MRHRASQKKSENIQYNMLMHTRYKFLKNDILIKTESSACKVEAN